MGPFVVVVALLLGGREAAADLVNVLGLDSAASAPSVLPLETGGKGPPP